MLKKVVEQARANLAKVQKLRVISRTSVMQYSGTTKTVPQIAQELKVDAVLEGSVLRIGNKVRITIELVDARTDRSRGVARADEAARAGPADRGRTRALLGT